MLPPIRVRVRVGFGPQRAKEHESQQVAARSRIFAHGGGARARQWLGDAAARGAKANEMLTYFQPKTVWHELQ